ncbi:GNAT family N-acetyltransferase [Trueperella pyogenes]|uniref:GNAT family N-acetyltransferase n=1 Tax=Trueperella pyogenes TaxID=1661 RepID=UPI00345DEE8A
MRWLRRPGRLRRLGAADRRAAIDLLATDPVATVLARVPIEEEWPRPAHALGLFDDAGSLKSVCWNGGNVVPFGFDDAGLDVLAAHLLSTRRLCSSIVGPSDQVMPLWERLGDSFGEPRQVRDNQLSMVYRGGSTVAPDESVRPARIGEGNLVVPASVAMFIEEVGYDPTVYGNGYAQRVHGLVRSGHTFVRMGAESGHCRVEFKADVGALAGGVAQIQGVWTAPDLRGQGIASAAMVRVANLVQATLAPTVSLYVNDYNLPAVRTYEKAGFETVGMYSTILL